MNELAIDATSADHKGQANQSSGVPRKLVYTLLGMVLFGYAPLLTEHIASLVLRPHYHFVLILPFAVYALAKRDLLQDATAILMDPPTIVKGIGGVVVCAVILAIAVVLNSPWLAAVSCVCTVLGGIHAVGGRHLTGLLFPTWLLLWLSIPLPLGSDQQLILKLRDVTTDWTSRVLDEIGILHLQSGNVIHLPNKSLFVADACSGIHSLFVLVGVALFYGLWFRRSVFHVLLLFVATIGIVLAENVARLVGIAGAMRSGLNLAEGWPHTIFGGVLFVVSLVLVVSADQLLLFIMPKRFDQVDVSNNPNPDAGSDLRLQQILRAMFPVAVVFMILGGLQFFTFAGSSGAQVNLILSDYPFEFSEFEENELPEEWDGWQRQGFEMTQRDPGNPFSRYSQTWAYKKNDTVAKFSLDYPYPELHPLSFCYEGIGWTVETKNAVTAANGADDLAPFFRVTMAKELYGHAALFYTSFDLDGRGYVPEYGSLKKTLATRFRGPQRKLFPQFMVQLVVVDKVPLDEPLEKDSADLFLKLRRTLVPICVQDMSQR